MQAFVAVAVCLLIVAIAAIAWVLIVNIQNGRKRSRHSTASSSSVDFGDVHAGFANIYNISAQTGITGFIHFDSEGILSDFFTVAGGGSELTFGSMGGGVYQATYSVTPSTGSTGISLFGLELNGTLIGSSIYGGSPITDQVIGVTHVNVEPGDTLQLRNLSSSIALAELPGDQVNASLTVARVG
jgi:hypothetical protein